MGDFYITGGMIIQYEGFLYNMGDSYISYGGFPYDMGDFGMGTGDESNCW